MQEEQPASFSEQTGTSQIGSAYPIVEITQGSTQELHLSFESHPSQFYISSGH